MRRITTRTMSAVMAAMVACTVWAAPASAQDAAKPASQCSGERTALADVIEDYAKTGFVHADATVFRGDKLAAYLIAAGKVAKHQLIGEIEGDEIHFFANRATEVVAAHLFINGCMSGWLRMTTEFFSATIRQMDGGL